MFITHREILSNFETNNTAHKIPITWHNFVIDPVAVLWVDGILCDYTKAFIATIFSNDDSRIKWIDMGVAIVDVILMEGI